MTGDFGNAILRNVSWQNSGITGNINFYNSDLSYANFTNSLFRLSADSGFRDTNLSHAVFVGADLTSQDLSNLNMRNANFSGAGLSSADLSDADLSGADIRNADLTGANLTGADLTGADLTGAVWSTTTCPDGTNSDDNGNTCENNL